ncbi:hypothetical protein BH11MYX1_BH11MYX1_08620 [soil metagenome]
MKKKLAIVAFAVLVLACGVWLWTSFPTPLPTVPHTRRPAPADARATTSVLPSER